MKKITYILVVLMLLCAVGVDAKSKKEKKTKAPKKEKVAKSEYKKANVFIFGFSASFNDSIVYMTNIDELKGVDVEKKSKFLRNREDYSDQLKTYLKGTGVKNPTCVVCFAEKRKNAEKKYFDFKKRYTGGKAKGYVMVNIDHDSFNFKEIENND